MYCNLSLQHQLPASSSTGTEGAPGAAGNKPSGSVAFGTKYAEYRLGPLIYPIGSLLKNLPNVVEYWRALK